MYNWNDIGLKKKNFHNQDDEFVVLNSEVTGRGVDCETGDSVVVD